LANASSYFQASIFTPAYGYSFMASTEATTPANIPQSSELGSVGRYLSMQYVTRDRISPTTSHIAQYGKMILTYQMTQLTPQTLHRKTEQKEG